MTGEERSRRVLRGVLGVWDDDRGFGFIHPEAGGDRVFAHISAFPRGMRPRQGLAVTYRQTFDERRRPRATEVSYVGGSRTTRQRPPGLLTALGGAALFSSVVVGLVVLDRLPAVVGVGYGALSALALWLYGADKSAARSGSWRISESTLHLVALVGGWPGALVARRLFRHKTAKQPFVTVFWLTVAGNVLALMWLLAGAPLPS